MSHYLRFFNRKYSKPDHPHRWLPKIGAPAPGHIGDHKPHGFRRFDRWYDRPLKAHKLYWRQRERQRDLAALMSALAAL